MQGYLNVEETETERWWIWANENLRGGQSLPEWKPVDKHRSYCLCRVVRAAICPLVSLGTLLLTFASATATQRVPCLWLWGKSVAMRAEMKSRARRIDYSICILHPRNENDAIVIHWVRHTDWKRKDNWDENTIWSSCFYHSHVTWAEHIWFNSWKKLQSLRHFENYLHRTGYETDRDNIPERSAHKSPEKHDVWGVNIKQYLYFKLSR